MRYTDRFDQALAYASRVHRDQFRKGGSIPYISHLLGVAAVVIENGADEDQAIAALLHDAVEDQGGAPRLADIRRLFGDRVAAMVDDCTDCDSEPRPPWQARKEAYIAGLAGKPRASLEVSIADKTHNVATIIADLHGEGAAVWLRFNAPKTSTLWYYRALSDAFTVLAPGSAAARLDRAVTELERTARAMCLPASSE